MALKHIWPFKIKASATIHPVIQRRIPKVRIRHPTFHVFTYSPFAAPSVCCLFPPVSLNVQQPNCPFFSQSLLLVFLNVNQASEVWSWNVFIKPCVCTYRFQNVFLRCPTPRLHRFPSSHWPSFMFLLFLAFLIPLIQFSFGLHRAVFCFGIHFNAILGNLPSAILWTWPYHVSWFCSISFIIVSSSPICCLIVTFLILIFYMYTKLGNLSQEGYMRGM